MINNKLGEKAYKKQNKFKTTRDWQKAQSSKNVESVLLEVRHSEDPGPTEGHTEIDFDDVSGPQDFKFVSNGKEIPHEVKIFDRENGEAVFEIYAPPEKKIKGKMLYGERNLFQKFKQLI